ncbi:Dual specificity phosphatase catalytic domain [Trypanosoma vivax]|uniref:Dual specificity protein phosphatase n=1 Tax=Trypanosoma vivax (strain Y486) TaxID=1055687 RepID=G0UC36_TRYVY|nr:Dual specificity phosphatase catalytic domain [Trypanosoma vivax]CCC53384.1 putative protein phosphatase-like protein [Trypanosoma vivax Y486]
MKLDRVSWTQPTVLVPCAIKVQSDEDSWTALSEVFTGLFLTCEKTARDCIEARNRDIALILTLNGESNLGPYRVLQYCTESHHFLYRTIASFDDFATELDDYTASGCLESTQSKKIFIRSVAAEDDPIYDIGSHFAEMCTLIEVVMANRRRLPANAIYKPNVLAHCLVGVSRSASIVAAYIMKRFKYPRDDALRVIKRCRPVICPNPGFCRQLFIWEKRGYHRFPDTLSASLSALEVCGIDDKLSFVRRQLTVLLQDSKFVSDRHFFGLVIAKAYKTDVELNTISTGIINTIDCLIADESYVDAPLLFHNVSEVVTSLIHYIPKLFNCLTIGAKILFDDCIYAEVLKCISKSGSEKHQTTVADALSLFMDAIYTRHLCQNPNNRPIALNSDGSVVGTLPEDMKLSFPILPFVAPYACGLLENAFPKYEPRGDTQTRECSFSTKDIFTDFIESLLKCSVAECSIEELPVVSHRQNTQGCHFLHGDMELQLLGSLAQGVDLPSAVDAYLADSSWDRNIDLFRFRRITGAVVGLHVLCESIDTFCMTHKITKPLDFGTYKTLVVWSEVASTVDKIQRAYASRHGEFFNFMDWIVNELAELTSCGIVTLRH